MRLHDLDNGGIDVAVILYCALDRSVIGCQAEQKNSDRRDQKPKGKHSAFTVPLDQDPTAAWVS